MKLTIFVFFLATSQELAFAQFNVGDIFSNIGKTVNQLQGAVKDVMNIAATTTTTAKTTITTSTPTSNSVSTTTPHNTTKSISPRSARSSAPSSDGLGGLLLNRIGETAQTLGNINGAAIGAPVQGPLNPLTLANSTAGVVQNGLSTLTQLVNTTADITNMAQDQANTVNGIIGQFQNLSNSIGSNFETLMQQLQNISVALSPDFSLLAPFLPIVRAFLNSTESRVNNVLDEFNKRVIATVRNSVGTLLNQTNGLQVWAAQQRSRLDGSEKKAEGEKIIDDFVNESSAKIQRCVNAVDRPIQEAYNYTREFVDSSLKLGNLVVNQLQNCLGGQKLLFVRIWECIQNGTQTMGKATDFFLHQILPIQSRVTAVSVRAVVEWSCIAAEGASIGTSKPVIEQNINRLISS